jgi:hypothetical protein
MLPALLLSLAVLGCENMTNGENGNGKSEDELRAERNKPIYEQFVGEWDEYLNDEFLTRIGSSSSGLVVTTNNFTIKNDSSSYRTTIDYTDIIYTLDELKKVVDYDGGVGSNDLSKDGFIKLEWYYENVFEFFKYHFYDKNEFSLKLVTRHPFDMDLPREEREKQQVSIDDGGISYYKRTGSSSGNGSGTAVDLPDAYSLTVGEYDCTLTFSANGTYTFDHPVGTDRSGTWSQNGGELTMTYTVSGSATVSDVFITTEEGNAVTLTLKDNSASVSNILASFNLAATSVTLTRQ